MKVLIKMWKLILFIILFLTFVYASWDNKIYRGEEAPKGAFAFACALFYGVNDSMTDVCGSSILSPYWILTAGHCIADERQIDDVYNYYAVAGTNYLDQLENAQIQKVILIVRSADYKFMNAPMPGDIALCKLEKQLWFNEMVQPINLPPPNYTVPAGKPVVMPGWGMNDSDVIPHVPSNALRYMVVPMLDLDDCRTKLDGFTNTSYITDKHCCTGFDPNDPKQGCPFDSGMPLCQFNPNWGQYMIVGIPSWIHYPCGAPTTPTVYTNPSYYTNFIVQTVELFI